MAEHSLNKFDAHLRRDLDSWTNPQRDPHAVTDVHTTAKAPESGQFSGDVVETPDGHSQAVGSV